MPGFDLIESYVSPFMQWLLITSVSATLIAGVVLLTQTLFGPWLTPAGRQRLWLLVLIRLILPVLPASALSIANIHFEKLWIHPQPEMHVNVEPDHPLINDIPFAPATHRAAPRPASRSWSEVMPVAAYAAWTLVVIAMFARLLWVNRHLALRLRNAPVIEDRATLELVRQCADIAKLRSVPAIVITNAVTTPAVFGILRPSILMPAGLLELLTPIQRRHVVLHEMSHIRHHDLLANWLLAILSIMHWFNPLLWLAMARMKADRELARDAWVLRNSESNDAASYADTLIDLAQRLLTRGNHLAAPLPGLFGRTTSLRRRLHMIARLSDSNRGSKLLSIGLLLLIGGGVLTGARAQTPTPQPEVVKSRNAVAQPTTQPSVDKLTQSARMLIRIGKYSEALEAIDQILKAQPKNEYATGVRLLLVDRIATVHPEVAVHDKLNKVLPSCHFDAVGFKDTIDFMRDILGQKITVNWPAVEASGFDRSTPVTVNLQNATAGKSLDAILDSASAGKEKLTYVVEADTIIITTKSDLGTDPVVRPYNVSDLFASADSSAGLIKTITEFIDRASWKENGGTIGSIKAINGMLTITQTPANHRRIATLLQTLRNSPAKED